MGRANVNFWWAIASIAGMALGAFGPWAKALGQSVGGTDGSNDGWLVFAVAAVALVALLDFARRPSAVTILSCLLAGVVGAAVTIYDRHNLSSAIKQSGSLAQAFVQVGWGLNLAMIASISLGLASLVLAGTAEFASPAALVSDQKAMYRECPHCKEQMRRDATVCPHCRLQSEAWEFSHGYWFKHDQHGRWIYLVDEERGLWSADVEDAGRVP